MSVGRSLPIPAASYGGTSDLEMTDKPVRFTESVTLASIGAGFLLMAIPPVRERILPALSPSTPWNKYADGLALVGLSYGLAFCALALGSAVMILKGGSLTRRVFPPSAAPGLDSKMKRPFLPGLFAAKPGGLSGLSAALIIGFGLRAYFLALPLRYDECMTFLQFVNRTAEDLFS